MGAFTKYKSHKLVAAAIIVAVEAGQRKVVVQDLEDETKTHKVSVGEDFFNRGSPAEGDYLVAYNDGDYLSWSPKAVFEAGYSEAEEGEDGEITVKAVDDKEVKEREAAVEKQEKELAEKEAELNKQAEELEAKAKELEANSKPADDKADKK